ncbi:MAG TPA: DoxX family protein [Candidatus Paceibacterota bacterium]|nr:DoxX family protein [Candidatus Paceibacterota bacterium]
MFASPRTAQLVLRIGLAIVFLWFGIDKFIQPQYWLDAWVPTAIQDTVGRIGVMPRDLIHLNGIFEILVGLSLATGFFLRYFAIAGAVFLIGVSIINGFNEVLIRDVGLLAGLVSLVLWPERTYV